ncbi:MAG: phosphatase PAP2 family protein [Pseudomonadota bacterium]
MAMTNNLSQRAAALAVSLLCAGCASGPAPSASLAPVAPPTSPAQVKEILPGYLAGYLARNELPNSLTLLPAPPVAGSAALAADEEAYNTTRALRDTPRWTVAVRDANLLFPQAAARFACTAGLPISQEATPNLNMLLRRTLADAGLSTYAAKLTYKRTRPFVAHGDASCTPAEEPELRGDGSYPSGHSAVGWAWALVLAELVPERADALLAHGHEFAQSRVVCGVHWQSDVLAGREMAAAAVARLHAHPMFTAQLAAAKAEIADARQKGVQAAPECKAGAN